MAEWDWRWSIRCKEPKNYIDSSPRASLWSTKVSESGNGFPMGRKCFFFTPVSLPTDGRCERMWF